MKFTDIQQGLEVLMESNTNKIAYIEGHAGIGKSQLTDDLVEKKNTKYNYELKKCISRLKDDTKDEFEPYEDEDYEIALLGENSIILKEWASNDVCIYNLENGTITNLLDSMTLSSRKYKAVTIFGSVVKEGEFNLNEDITLDSLQ